MTPSDHAALLAWMNLVGEMFEQWAAFHYDHPLLYIGAEQAARKAFAEQAPADPEDE